MVIVRRTLSPGFAGIPDPPFAGDNSLILFGDEKQMAMDLAGALKEA